MASQALIYKQVTLIQNVVNKNMLTKNPEQYLLFCLICQNIRVNSIQSFKLVKKYFEEINLFLLSTFCIFDNVSVVCFKTKLIKIDQKSYTAIKKGKLF